MRYISVTAILGFLVLLGSAAQAEMYKYRDAQGNVCFTDNLAQIPVDQRPNAHTMQMVGAEDDAAAPQEESAKGLIADDAAESDEPAEMVVTEETIAALNDRKKELDRELSSLMTEKYALLKEKDKLSGLAGRDVKARKAYESKVTELNKRIADFKMRRDAFQKECEQVKQVLEPPAPEAEAANPIE